MSISHSGEIQITVLRAPGGAPEVAHNHLHEEVGLARPGIADQSSRSRPVPRRDVQLEPGVGVTQVHLAFQRPLVDGQNVPVRVSQTVPHGGLLVVVNHVRDLVEFLVVDLVLVLDGIAVHLQDALDGRGVQILVAHVVRVVDARDGRLAVLALVDAHEELRAGALLKR